MANTNRATKIVRRFIVMTTRRLRQAPPHNERLRMRTLHSNATSIPPSFM